MSARIVFLGAADAHLGPALLGDLFAEAEKLRGSTLWLVDTDADALAIMRRYAERINAALGEPFILRASTDRREALPEATFVILDVDVDHLTTWKADWQIPLRHGVRHVLGANGGPGGLSRALRVIPQALAVARDVEQLAPEAWVINLADPLSRVCMALDRYTRVRWLGLCPRISEGYLMVNRVLGLVSEHGDRAEDVHALRQRVRITAAGLNHFTFILELRDARSGEDLYPAFRARLAHMPLDFAPLTRRMMDAFGLFCTAGDEHAGEFVGFAAEVLPLRGFDFVSYARWEAEQWARIRAVAEGTALLDMASLVRRSEMRMAPVLLALQQGTNQWEDAVNVRNRGFIANLPDEAIVEAPAFLNAAGVHGVQVGALPRALASIMRREVDIQALTVEAAVHGDRRAALQALLLDPHIHSYAQATYLLDDLLRTHARYLPQFA